VDDWQNFIATERKKDMRQTKNKKALKRKKQNDKSQASEVHANKKSRST